MISAKFAHFARPRFHLHPYEPVVRRFTRGVELYDTSDSLEQ